MSTKVTISDSVHTVSVEHDGLDLEPVVVRAQRLWNETAKPVRQGPGFELETEISLSVLST
jgi:hypothetical protein